MIQLIAILGGRFCWGRYWKRPEQVRKTRLLQCIPTKLSFSEHAKLAPTYFLKNRHKLLQYLQHLHERYSELEQRSKL